MTVTPYSVCDHQRKLLETEFAISILVCLHDSLVHNLLQLRILPTKAVSLDMVIALFLCGGRTNLEVTPDHHLQHQKQLSVGDVPVSVHIIDLERDWGRRSVNLWLSTTSTVFSGGKRTPQFLLSPSPAAECAQTSNEFLKVYRSTATVGTIGVSRTNEIVTKVRWFGNGSTGDS